LHEKLQLGLDALVGAPQWAGLALLALAAVITALGRHGQRPLNAALLGGGAVALALFTLRGAVHLWIPGVVAVIGGVLAACFGLAVLVWGTAFAMAAILGGAGALLARRLGLSWVVGFSPLAGMGLFAGVTKYQRISVFLPPIFAALFAALGAAIAWAPHQHGAKLWMLNDVEWTLGLAVLLLFPLLALSLEREHRRKRRLAMRTREMADSELKKKIASQKAAYDRSLQRTDH
jgi:hypothetical protein